MARLGEGAYRAQVLTRSGTAVATLGDELVVVDWSRVLDENSAASVQVRVTPECCQQLANIRSVAHELVIWRDPGGVVWHGPIIQVRYAQDLVDINARGVLWWMYRRVVHQDIVHTGSAAVDLTQHALAIIRDALDPDDPNVLSHLITADSGLVEDREAIADQGPAWNELDELLRTGLDVTELGHRLILGGDLRDIGTLPVLSDGHFRSGVTVIDNGLKLSTRVVVRGAGVIGHAGGVDPFYGLVETVFTEDAVVTQADADALAARIVSQRGGEQLVVLGGDEGAVLSSDAPVDVTSLVPGMTVTVALTDICRPVVATLRLLRVDCRWMPEEGETLGVRFGPIGTELRGVGEE